MRQSHKNRRILNFGSALTATLCLGLSACGNYGPDVKEEFAQKISSQWRIDRFQIDSWEITNRSPARWHYQFTANIAPTQDLYENLGTLNGTSVLRPVVRKDSEMHITGTANAIQNDFHWQSQFNFDSASGIAVGAPITAYGKNVFVVGSQNRDNFLATVNSALRDVEQQLVKDEASVSQLRTQLQEAGAAYNTSAQQAESSVQSEQQQLRLNRLQIDATIGREVQAADMNLQSDMRAQLDGAKRELDASNLAIYQSHQVRMQSVQRQYQDLSRQRLPREESAEKNRQLREQDVAAQQRFRDESDQARNTYYARVKGIQQAFQERRSRLRDDITNRVSADIEKSGAELQERVQQQMSGLQETQDALARQHEAVDQLSADMTRRRAELDRQRALVAQLQQN
ncbi:MULTISPECIES: hypothetical protein [Pandoraea]|uniref:hypothetical protein n=1 Tax=Pandoraea TaxID=93217 RepID=UPI001F5D8759|nr:MULTISPECIES: hypothetical protein [Pandoraea]